MQPGWCPTNPLVHERILRDALSCGWRHGTSISITSSNGGATQSIDGCAKLRGSLTLTVQRRGLAKSAFGDGVDSRCSREVEAWQRPLFMANLRLGDRWKCHRYGSNTGLDRGDVLANFEPKL